MVKFSLIQLAVCCTSVGAFAPIASTKVGTSTQMPMAVEDESSRRSFFNKIVGSTAVAGMALLQTPFPANAFGGGGKLKRVNDKLAR